MDDNVLDVAILLRDLFMPTVEGVNASLDFMKNRMAVAK